MISPNLPWPPSSGSDVRILHLLRGLSRHYQVTFLSSAASYCPEAIDEVQRATSERAICVNVPRPLVRLKRFTSLLSPRPYHVAYFTHSKTRRIVSELLRKERFSLIYANYIYSLAAIPNGTKVPIVVDQQNVDREMWERKIRAQRNSVSRLYCKLNLSKTIRYENASLCRIEGYVSVSERDRQLTRMYAATAVKHFFVAPNGVDTEFYAPKPTRELHDTSLPVTIGFMGSMDLAINITGAVTLVEEILPLIRRQFPSRQVRGLIIGRNPSLRVRNLAKQDPLVQVTGTVEDVRPFLHEVDIFAAPLHEGGGTKLRILEAMSCGLPVVGSEMALQGIEGFQDGLNARLALTASNFVDVIAELIRSSDLCYHLGRNARDLVVARYSWTNITDQLALDIRSLACS